MKRKLTPENWGLRAGNNGEAIIQNSSIIDLADIYGTPLHVINEERLRNSASNFKESMQSSYEGKVSIHYAFKCNSVPYIVDIIRQSGLNAEVATEYELYLAIRTGFSPDQIIVNGPNKTKQFIQRCFETNVRFIIVDSLEEIITLEKVGINLDIKANILLRINPNYIPSGMNSGSATGSRKASLFGLDLEGHEVHEALKYIKESKSLNFYGYHFHIGTGINYPKEYDNVINLLSPLFKYTLSEGFKINVIDVGGGISASTSRELTSFEMILYQAFNHLPVKIGKLRKASFIEFGKAISSAVKKYFSPDDLPELIYEPGRAITSQNQFLLLKVHKVKRRKGIRTWLITDGGLGTTTLPTYYEYHEIFLCNDLHRPKTKRVSINGSCCFSSDIVYKNKLMPSIFPDEVIAIMDTGAYFTSLESQFGFQRPAIITVNKDGHELVRNRESFSQMIERDNLFINKSVEGVLS